MMEEQTTIGKSTAEGLANALVGGQLARLIHQREG
jgi:hypothetical protein